MTSKLVSLFAKKDSPVTATEIAEAIPKAKTPADFHALIQAVANRHEAIAQREREIGSFSSMLPVSAEWEAATALGPEADRELVKELDDLEFESGYLHRLRTLLFRGMEEAETAEIKAKFGQARRRLTGEIESVQKAFAEYARKVEELNATVECIGNYERVGEPFPLSDDEVNALLQARESAWTPLRLLTLIPLHGGKAENITKFPLAFTWFCNKLDDNGEADYERGGIHITPRNSYRMKPGLVHNSDQLFV